MAISLYDLSVGSFQQTLGAVAGFLQRGADHCKDKGLDPQTLVATRLYDDMLPFAFQIVSVSHHSAGALDGAKAGAFGPPGQLGDLDYPALQKLVTDSQSRLAAWTPDAVNALEGKDVTFAIGANFKLPFTAENFLMSFSMPNFFFHATTAYDILRQAGVPLGKRDFMGAVRTKS
ncbi:MAG TPA: DUF1993 domain-containing protein [Caulobacteraceae bacterium]|jgi:hypothetical protein